MIWTFKFCFIQDKIYYPKVEKDILHIYVHSILTGCKRVNMYNTCVTMYPMKFFKIMFEKLNGGKKKSSLAEVLR